VEWGRGVCGVQWLLREKEGKNIFREIGQVMKSNNYIYSFFYQIFINANQLNF
jgi:hypothetical protein